MVLLHFVGMKVVVLSKQILERKMYWRKVPVNAWRYEKTSICKLTDFE